MGYTVPRDLDSGRHRALSIPHPNSQIEMARFYDEYKHQILFATSRSNFSLRYPIRTARFTISLSPRSKTSLSGPQGGTVEDSSNNDSILRSYFHYQKYSNVFQFYDSPEFVSLESKFPVLMQLDIAQCFQSVYTHSIAWASLGKDQAKEDSKPQHFSNKFDKLMQDSNHGETNGILIGPEISRVFAEVILQRVDREVEFQLNSLDLERTIDYEIGRYVDDYFLYAKDAATSERIRDVLVTKLRNFNLHLNSAKESIKVTPVITPISIAKASINEALDRTVPSTQSKLTDYSSWSMTYRATRAIFEYKRSVAMAAVEHKDVVSYALAALEQRVDYLIINAASVSLTQQKIQDLLVGIVELATYLLGTARLVTPTIRMCRILHSVHDFATRTLTERSRRDLLHDVIRVSITQLLTGPASVNSPEIGFLYLLGLLHSIGGLRTIPQEKLRKILDLENSAKKSATDGSNSIYFALMSTLHMVGNNRLYASLKLEVLEIAIARIESLPSNSCERILLFVDLISCPYVARSVKEQLFDQLEVENSDGVREWLSRGLFSFTQWKKFDFAASLEDKRSLAAY